MAYLNPAAFTTAPLLYPASANPINNSNFCTTAFGDLGRNTYRGPSQQNWDFSLLKNFQLTERNVIRFTADFSTSGITPISPTQPRTTSKPSSRETVRSAKSPAPWAPRA